MAAPTTFSATGTFYNPDGTLAAGQVTFTPLARTVPSSDVVPVQPVVAALVSGVLSQALVQGVAYTVQEQLTGKAAGGVWGSSYQIPGTGSVDLSTITSASPTTAPYQNGTSHVNNAASAVTVTHNLPSTPTWVDISPTSAIVTAVQVYISAITSTTFTVTTANAAGTATAVGAQLNFQWEAHI